MTTILSTPLYELLMIAPAGAVRPVQQAMRHVAAGEWKEAAKQMNVAAEVSETEDAWYLAAGKAADELHRHYYK